MDDFGGSSGFPLNLADSLDNSTPIGPLSLVAATRQKQTSTSETHFIAQLLYQPTSFKLVGVSYMEHLSLSCSFHSAAK